MRRWKRSLHPFYPVYNHLSWEGGSLSRPKSSRLTGLRAALVLQARTWQHANSLLAWFPVIVLLSQKQSSFQSFNVPSAAGTRAPDWFAKHTPPGSWTEVAHIDIDEMLWQSISSSDLCRIAEATYYSTSFSAFYLLFTASYYLATGSLPSCQSSFSSCHSSNSADSPAVFPTCCVSPWCCHCLSSILVINVRGQFSLPNGFNPGWLFRNQWPKFQSSAAERVRSRLD